MSITRRSPPAGDWRAPGNVIGFGNLDDGQDDTVVHRAKQELEAALPVAFVITSDGREPPTPDEALSTLGQVTLLLEVGADEFDTFERDPEVQAWLDTGVTVVAMCMDSAAAMEWYGRITAARGKLH